MAKKASPKAAEKHVERACLPTQTVGDTYEAAMSAHPILVDPEAQTTWDRADVKVLAKEILGNMLVEPVGAITFRQGEDVVEERVARRIGLPAWQDRRKELVATLGQDLASKLKIEQFDELARPLGDEQFDEQPEWDGWDDDESTYSVMLHTRLGWVFGTGQCWAHGLARAIAAYMELRRRAELTIAPIPQKYAFEFIEMVHRHHFKPPGWKFGLGVWSVVNDLDTLIGVATVGRPTSAALQAQGAWEVQRVAVLEGGQNLCSALYGACWREAKSRGCTRLVTFVLPSEGGASLRAAGWQLVAEDTGGGSWGREGRERKDKAPTCKKNRWEISTTPRAKPAGSSH